MLRELFCIKNFIKFLRSLIKKYIEIFIIEIRETHTTPTNSFNKIPPSLCNLEPKDSNSETFPIANFEPNTQTNRTENTNSNRRKEQKRLQKNPTHIIYDTRRRGALLKGSVG